MTTRIQKRKAVPELVFGDFEASVAENSQSENLVAGPSKSPKMQAENMDELKTSLRKAIISNLTRILPENQKEMLKLIAPTVKKSTNLKDSGSETKNTHPASTSTPIKSKVTTFKNNPISNRNSIFNIDFWVDPTQWKSCQMIS